MSDLSKKLSDYLEGKIQHKPESDFRGFDEFKNNTDKVRDSLYDKLSDYYVRIGIDESPIERAAEKYYESGLSNIIAAERKAKNLLTLATDEVEKYINEVAEKQVKKYRDNLTDEQKTGLVKTYIRDCVIGNYGTDETDTERHAKYNELVSEERKAEIEYRGVKRAKQRILEENADIIAEAKKQKAIKDLQKSGILTELGLAESEENE